MAKERLKKVSASEADGVQYRRAKLWQIILVSCNALIGMSVYTLIGMASYSASIGYGIATVSVGLILTCTRVLDAITDPLLAFLYDRVNTKHGKIRILMALGWAIQAIALYGMFTLFSSKGFGFVTFILLYILYVIGYTIINMTGQTINPIITNDPKQRPTLGVWNTTFNYLVPIVLNMVLMVVLLPKFGGTYNQEYLSAAVLLVLGVSFVGLVLVSIGVSEYDKPETFEHLTKKHERLKFKDMWGVLKSNKPLQSYIAANASDKIAQQTGSQAIVTTMLYGIIIGNMGMSTILTMVAMLPSIVFAIFGAKYAGKHGNKESIVFWSKICILVSILTVAFFAIVDTKSIATMGLTMIAYVIFMLALNGVKMCVTTASSAFMADVIDYELDRSGKYVPAVVSGTYSLVDKIISALSATIAAGGVALIGYTASMPQPGDALTPSVFWLTMFLIHGLSIIGWLVSLWAMKNCKLDKAEMINVQKRIADKKAEAKAEMEAGITG